MDVNISVPHNVRKERATLLLGRVGWVLLPRQTGRDGVVRPNLSGAGASTYGLDLYHQTGCCEEEKMETNLSHLPSLQGKAVQASWDSVGA